MTMVSFFTCPLGQPGRLKRVSEKCGSTSFAVGVISRDRHAQKSSALRVGVRTLHNAIEIQRGAGERPQRSSETLTWEKKALAKIRPHIRQ